MEKAFRTKGLPTPIAKRVGKDSFPSSDRPAFGLGCMNYGLDFAGFPLSAIAIVIRVASGFSTFPKVERPPTAGSIASPGVQ